MQDPQGHRSVKGNAHQQLVRVLVKAWRVHEALGVSQLLVAWAMGGNGVVVGAVGRQINK